MIVTHHSVYFGRRKNLDIKNDVLIFSFKLDNRIEIPPLNTSSETSKEIIIFTEICM